MVVSRVPSQGALSTESVDGFSLSDLFAVCGIESCDFLKVDIEGSEFEIFLTASRATLQRIEKIAMEYHEKGCGEGWQLVEVFKAAGFQVKQTPELNSDRGMIYATRSIKSTN
jgi:hypothetical protein